MKAMAAVVALGLAAGAGADESLVFRGTATTAGDAAAPFHPGVAVESATTI